MTNNDSPIHQKLLILIFYHKNQEIPNPAFTCSVNNGNTRTMCGVCSKLTTKTPGQLKLFWNTSKICKSHMLIFNH